MGCPVCRRAGPEVQRPVINGDRCSDLVPRLEEGRVVFQPGEEHPPLERRRQQVPSFSMTAGGACRAGPPGVPVKRTSPGSSGWDRASSSAAATPTEPPPRPLRHGDRPRARPTAAGGARLSPPRRPRAIPGPARPWPTRLAAVPGQPIAARRRNDRNTKNSGRSCFCRFWRFCGARPESLMTSARLAVAESGGRPRPLCSIWAVTLSNENGPSRSWSCPYPLSGRLRRPQARHGRPARRHQPLVWTMCATAPSAAREVHRREPKGSSRSKPSVGEDDGVGRRPQARQRPHRPRHLPGVVALSSP